MPAFEKSITEDLKARLDNAGIDFVVSGNGSLCVAQSDIKRVPIVLERLADTYIPVGRSMALHSDIHAAVVVELEKKGIPYREVCFDGSTYLVWNDGHAQEVEDLIEVETARYLAREFGR